MTVQLTLASAARRTGLAHNGAAMSRVCSAAGVAVLDGRVNLASFDGGDAELQLSPATAVVAGTL